MDPFVITMTFFVCAIIVSAICLFFVSRFRFAFFFALLSVFFPFALFDDKILGIPQLFDPLSLHRLTERCLALDASNATVHASKSFVVHEMFLQPLKRMQGLSRATAVTWEELAVALRYALKTHNHSLLSSKVSFRRVFEPTQQQLPILNSFGAWSEAELFSGERQQRTLSESGKSKIRAAVAAAREAGETNILIKPSTTVRGEGHSVFDLSTNHREDLLFAAVFDCVNAPLLPKALHMSTVERGCLLQEFWRGRQEQRSSSPNPIAPRIHRWFTGAASWCPFEFKVVVVWGRAVVAHTHQIPGCRYFVYPLDESAESGSSAADDGECPSVMGSDQSVGHQLWRLHAKKMRSVAEALAHATGNPWFRIDFFVSLDGALALNEVEVVEGTEYFPPESCHHCMARLLLSPLSQRTNVLRSTNRTDEEITNSIRKDIAKM